MRRICIIVTAVLVLSGCASTQSQIRGTQYLEVDTGVGPSTVAIYLGDYRDCRNGLQDCEDHRGDEIRNRLYREFEGCLASGMRRTAPEVRLVPRLEWMQHPNSESSMRSFLTAEKNNPGSGSQESLDNLPVDWVVVLEGRHEISPRVQVAEIEEQDGVVMMGIGEEWTKTSTLNAGIWRTDTGVRAADLSATLSGDAFWMLPTLYIIPLVPFGWSPDVEGRSCRELGAALGRFFEGAGNASVE